MKYLLLLSLLFLACEKQAPVSASDISNAGDPDSIYRAVYINDMCFDGTNYHVDYTVGGLRKNDLLFGGCTNGIDTLSKVQLMPRNGSGTFVAGTRESGCNVKVYLYILKPTGGKTKTKKQGNCVKCN